ncbi:MAG TPA: hypothetical protein DCR40_00875 [Prolixibacteraceae bacterium]|nr:hypothetical protein [Prolixibacteraceae bacterium]
MYQKIDEITNETPVTFLTVGQLISVFNRSEKRDQTPAKAPIPKIYGIDIFCDVTGYKKPTAYSKTSKNEVPFFKLGNKILFDRDKILEWMTANPIETKDEVCENLDSKLTNRKDNAK